jgi:hypothetical protein
MIAPVVLSDGTCVFEGKVPGLLRLANTRTWEHGGTALVRYELIPENA